MQMQSNSLPTIFIQPTEQNKLQVLFDEYNQTKSDLRKIADFAEGKEDIMYYFFTGSGVNRNFAERVFDFDLAMKVLNSEYWQKVINMTDVLQTMPAAKRNEWNDMIRERKTPDFTKETVATTIQSLMSQRDSFLSQKVQDIFFNLSNTHVTNSPSAFTKRIIFSNVLSDGRTRWEKCEYLDDLREVIGRARKIPYKSKMLSRENIDYLIKNPDNYGKWFSFDGGAFKMRIYKVGTAHIEVHPEVAVELNLILAENNKCVIPHTTRPTKTQLKKVEPLRNDLIDFDVLNLIASSYDNLVRYGSMYYSSYYEDKATAETIEGYKKVLTYLGGIEDKRGHFHFDYPVAEVIGELLRVGYLPEQKTHQFYPTKMKLAKELVSKVKFKKDSLVLEPSAGQGGIADALPKNIKLDCVEINPLHCSVLKSKGYKVTEGDFLSYWPKKEYDYIVMNPPFSNNQAWLHIEKAFSLLKNDGVILAILPANMKDDVIIKGQTHEYSDIIEDAFDDTNISVVILKLTRVHYARTRFE